MNNRQTGFTLVELAIVLMIIGLLIGGILKGQELIQNARITTTLQQIKSYDAAVTTFRDSYNALPGDIANPSTRLPNCTANYCSDSGDNNGIVGTLVTAITGSMADRAERGNFFVHMASANLISGVQANIASGTADVWGNFFPAAKIGGGFNGISATVTSPPVRGLNLLMKNTSNFVIDEATGAAALTPSQAARIDRKMDDGLPQSGDVIGVGTSNCTGATYTESTVIKDCNLLIHIQG